MLTSENNEQIKTKNKGRPGVYEAPTEWRSQKGEIYAGLAPRLVKLFVLL